MLLEYLYDALGEKIGLVILTDSPERLRAKLYAVRKEHAPAFEDLSFVISPTEPETQLWILKRHADPSEITSALDI